MYTMFTHMHRASWLESAAGRAPTISSARALNSRHSRGARLSRCVDNRCALARRPLRQRRGLWRARISGIRTPACPSEPCRAATNGAKRQRARSPTLLSVYRLALFQLQQLTIVHTLFVGGSPGTTQGGRAVTRAGRRARAGGARCGRKHATALSRIRVRARRERSRSRS
jgi:hypothetical protein